jgi:hypothetical protein
MSESSLIDAVKNGDYAEAERAIRNGADLHLQDEQGWTALNFAAGRGDLALVKLLVENGADIFKAGRDQRTPYMIALAAGRIPVAQYLREVEDQYPGKKPERRQRKYCKAYPLAEMRAYPGWSESRINWKDKNDERDNQDSYHFTDDKIVFLHEDLTVTESIWHDENVIFDHVDPSWEEFCKNSLNFEVPDDLDLIVPIESYN